MHVVQVRMCYGGELLLLIHWQRLDEDGDKYYVVYDILPAGDSRYIPASTSGRCGIVIKWLTLRTLGCRLVHLYELSRNS